MTSQPSDGLNVADPAEKPRPRIPGQAETPTPTPTSTAPTEPPAGLEDMQATRRVQIKDLQAYYGDTHAVRGVSIAFEPGHVTAIIGPSGCGKSTMVRCVNRMHEEIPGARSEGKVLLADADLTAST